MPAISSFVAFHVSRISRRAGMLDSASPLFARPPNGPARSTGISDKVLTLLPIEVDLSPASVDGGPTPPTPVYRKALLGLLGWLQCQSII